jgi:CheY-like chemotaxis protein
MPSLSVVALSILVADDEDSVRNLLVFWLQRLGHDVTSVGNAREAMRYAAEQTFDLVITDVVMPDGDGFELIGALRKAQSAARILAISGGGKFLQGTDCLKVARGLGAHAVLMKPFSWEQFQGAVDSALRAGESNAA